MYTYYNIDVTTHKCLAAVSDHWPFGMEYAQSPY